MKKALTIVVLCIVFVIIYFVQLNFFCHFTIAGVKPNLFVMFVLFIGLYSGARMGTAFGVLFGLVIDFLGSNLIGGACVILGVIGFLRWILRKKFLKR